MSRILVQAAVFAMLVASAVGQRCPTWFVPQSGKCVCGWHVKNLLDCFEAQNETSITNGFCLTYNNDTEHFGQCPYNVNTTLIPYHTVPADVLKLDREMCGPLHRTGLLCSHCQQGLGPALFSYYKECKECLPQPFGWMLFFVRLAVPVTVFCVIIIVFRINIASPALNGFVLAAQVISSGVHNNQWPFIVNGLKTSYCFSTFVADCYGLFSLDFFTYLIPSFCISKDMSMHTVLSLEYITALYPILFTLSVYFSITLYHNGNKAVRTCLRPFHRCFIKLCKKWKLKGSILNAFATCLLLSYSKLCSISLYLLQPVPVYDKYGNVTYRLYYGADHEVQSHHYLLHLALASGVIIVMVILPALFILFYQNCCFQRCLYYCKIKCVLIHELANITQGCFKNGTVPGTRDYRWFAGLYLLLRVVLVFSINQQYHLIVYLTVFSLMSLLVATLRPYKTNCYNFIDSFFWLFFASGIGWYVYFKRYNLFWNGVIYSYTVGCLPLFCLFGFICLKMVTSVLRWCRAYCISNKSRNEDMFAHRILSPNEYTPLVIPASEA